ncbi:biliverdin-producing heme oxygenase [Variovorax sp.]|jgi:heme oxygenase (biliverdin-IX-beta and delta-forming)|uniref:biliverdin-producing heme oxygenase n=3 Tax=Variovorax sp. TaxID=1871043 RepID=UPI0025E7CD95|nr:biliverdin-producing heme oxygenase [Variovorax sp.]
MAAPGPAASAALQPLREATRELHHALDSRLRIGGEDATLADYAEHLRALRPWLGAVRSALAASGVAALEAVSRQLALRLEALELDLRDLRDLRDAPAARPATPPALPDSAALAAQATDPGFAWGLAYVVEGSRLGGSVMHRRLAPRLAPHPMRYFAPVGAEDGTPAHWRHFVAQLGEALRDTAAMQSAQRGAVAGFEALMPCFGLAREGGTAPSPSRAASLHAG